MPADKTCAFLTLEQRAGFFIYDSLTFPKLHQLGWSVVEIPWDRPGIDWSSFDAVVVRSTWDYQAAPAKFMAVLEQIEFSGTMLLNPAAVCRWNMTKTYLREMAARGVPIVPTRWLNSLTRSQLTECLAGQRCVAKPLVGANADDTFVLQPDDASTWAEPLTVFSSQPLMLQPFLASIQTVGEYSLFYFAGQLSHAILKRPQPGDFRVQEEHGGTIENVSVSEDLRHIGQQALAAVGEDLLYARVDLVQLDDGTHVLMELELIEPSLYFGYGDQAAERFAVALDQMASGR